MKNNLVLLLFMLLLSACGGSGSEPEVEDTEEVIEEAADSTSDLVVNKNVDMNFQYKLNIQLDEGREGFVSIYSEFDERQEGIEINYKSRLYSGLAHESGSFSLVVPEHISSLIIEKRFRSNDYLPEYTFWARGEGYTHRD